MTITPRSVQKWVQERVQNDRHNLHAKHPCGFQATFPVQRLIPFPYQTCTLSASLAVRLYCLRFAFAFTLDLEVE